MRPTRHAGAGIYFAGALLFAVTSASAQVSDECLAIRLGTVGWLDAGASAGLASALLAGLGYQPTVQKLSAPTIFASLKNENLEATLDIMVPTMGADLKPYILDNSVELLRRNLTGTKYTLATNSHGRKLGLDHFDKISLHADTLDRTIYGVEPGTDGNLLIADMIAHNRYGLGEFNLVESSEPELMAAITEANRTSRPLVFLGWEPHPMNVRFELTYLAGGDDVFGAAFGGADVYTGVRATLARDCPNVVLLLGNLELSLSMINEIMTAILEFKAQPLVAAVAWIRQQPQVLEPWLTGVATRGGGPGIKAVRDFVGLGESDQPQ